MLMVVFIVLGVLVCVGGYLFNPEDDRETEDECEEDEREVISIVLLLLVVVFHLLLRLGKEMQKPYGKEETTTEGCRE
jgi:hypothetical protein